MNLSKGLSKALTKQLTKTYLEEHSYITKLLSDANLPVYPPSDDSDSDKNENEENKSGKIVRLKETERAKSLEELHQRLAALKDEKFTYKGKKLKNRLKSKLKRKMKSRRPKEQRNQPHADVAKAEPELAKPKKPVFNSGGNLVFSKFDFLGETTSVVNPDTCGPRKQPANKKKILEQLEKQKSYVKKLESEGDTETAYRVKEKTAWNNMLKKAEGIKVKDDPVLLKKTLAKKERIKKSSQKKWKHRMKIVERQKQEKQKKRTENINKRNEVRKKKKFKKAVKKGKFIPNV